MKVEGNYKGKGKWFKGKIRRERPDGTYDIDYEDGESEMRLTADLIRPVQANPSPALGSAHSRLEEGMKVEGNYRGKGKWFPGKIRRDRGDGTYDINYDDGETEMRVTEDMIRPIETSSARHQSPASRRSAHRCLEEGMKVEGNYRARGRFFPGRIKRDRGDGTYDIDYDDGEQESRVKEEDIRALQSTPPSNGTPTRARPSASLSRDKTDLRQGMKVEGNYKGKGKWFPGTIMRVRLNGTCDIDYDDGEQEMGVKPEDVRVLGRGAQRGSPARKARLEEGSKVEANYRGRGKFFPGRIRRDRGDGTFDIDYDDGESELKVKEADIRLLENHSRSSPSRPNRSRTRLEEGMKVEGNYRARGRFFPGRIKRDRGDGTYDIDYDDGEQESRVKEEDIRVLGGGSTTTNGVSGKFNEGAKVEGNYRSKGKWYAARIKRVVSDKTYDLDYDDGETEKNVSEENIRMKGTTGGNGGGGAVFTEKMRIEANYRQKGRFYPGHIEKVNSDGTYYVLYEDGETETRVHGTDIRPHPSTVVEASSRNNYSAAASFTMGMKVECNYRKRGKYYPGKISKLFEDGSYGVDYDDGELETRVNANEIRAA
jgi:hypothetical protein